MKKPIIWVLEPNSYSYRVQFDFINSGGDLIKSMKWQVNQEKDGPPQVCFLQANARLGSQKPRWEDMARNFIRITILVESLTGELDTKTFSGFLGEAQINQILAAAPLTLGIVVDGCGVHISLYTAKVKGTP